MNIEKSVYRDQANAQKAQEEAKKKLGNSHSTSIEVDFTRGISSSQLRNIKLTEDLQRSLIAISNNPFDAMMDVVTETERGTESQLWYANERTTSNAPILEPIILAWSHPGVQLALTGQLGEKQDIKNRNYYLKSVIPISRAKFQRVLPSIKGLYEPGGSIGFELEENKVGLKAVKLSMTREQVDAFISQMFGTMIITGAPGSGKTTVALQRIRFLIDQQYNYRSASQGDTTEIYSEKKTRVFLANANLIGYARSMLRNELSINGEIVEEVQGFVDRYLRDIWKSRDGARLINKDISFLESRGREAMFARCDTDDLLACWKEYEKQIIERLGRVKSSPWFEAAKATDSKTKEMVGSLANALLKIASTSTIQSVGIDPRKTVVAMDRVYIRVQEQYEQLRSIFNSTDTLKALAKAFFEWLYYVYDPLSCLYDFFSERRHVSGVRIREGTAGKVDENGLVNQILNEMKDRKYGMEQLAWLAWLLRFVMPEDVDPRSRFRDIPPAQSPTTDSPYGLWSHIVIDEAQDLSAAEASLLGSFVDPAGAITISADFKQIVSPVHAIENPRAFFIGSALYSATKNLTFTFSRNMRQTKEISDFLRGFYKKNFHESPPFQSNQDFHDSKPELHIIAETGFAQLIRQRWNVLKASGRKWSVAVLQVNEDEEQMNVLRRRVQSQGVDIAPLWDTQGPTEQLLTTSVERAKGLEFDVCYIIGLDESGNSSLHYILNRAYVALSRPARRLSILCSEFPESLKGIESSLFTVFRE